MGRTKDPTGRIKMGRLQLVVMRVLWEHGKLNAREIAEVLKKAKPPIIHSTVQTLLQKLKEKRAVGYERRGRVFYYFPLVEESEVIRDATRNLIGRMFGGSPAALLGYILKEETIPPAELQELGALIDARLAKRGARGSRAAVS